MKQYSEDVVLIDTVWCPVSFEAGWILLYSFRHDLLETRQERDPMTDLNADPYVTIDIVRVDIWHKHVMIDTTVLVCIEKTVELIDDRRTLKRGPSDFKLRLGLSIVCATSDYSIAWTRNLISFRFKPEKSQALF